MTDATCPERNCSQGCNGCDNCTDYEDGVRAEVAPTSPASGALPADPQALHAAIMNLPCNPPEDANINQRLSFKAGHKEARHAAAELALAALASREATNETMADEDVERFYPELVSDPAVREVCAAYYARPKAGHFQRLQAIGELLRASREASPAPLTDDVREVLEQCQIWHRSSDWRFSEELLRKTAWEKQRDAIDAALSSPQIAPALSEGPGIERAARHIEKTADDYANEHGRYDPDTGATEFSDAGMKYLSTLRELADDIRALAAPAPVAPTPAEPTETQLLALVVDNPGSFEGGQRAAAINRGRERYAAFLAAAPGRVAPTPAQPSLWQSCDVEPMEAGYYEMRAVSEPAYTDPVLWEGRCWYDLDGDAIQFHPLSPSHWEWRRPALPSEPEGEQP